MTTSTLLSSRRARAAALLLALPLLAGCSAAATTAHSQDSSSKSPSSASSSSSGSGKFVEKKPCDYLSAAQASAAIGAKVKSSEVGGACMYSGGNLVGFGTTITGITGADDANWKEEVKSVAAMGGTATPLPGVGDEAYAGRSSFEEKVVVRSGDAAIEIADADGQAKNFTKSIAIAKAIIANLGS